MEINNMILEFMEVIDEFENKLKEFEKAYGLFTDNSEEHKVDQQQGENSCLTSVFIHL